MVQSTIIFSKYFIALPCAENTLCAEILQMILKIDKIQKKPILSLIVTKETHKMQANTILMKLFMIIVAICKMLRIHRVV